MPSKDYDNMSDEQLRQVGVKRIIKDGITHYIVDNNIKVKAPVRASKQPNKGKNLNGEVVNPSTTAQKTFDDLRVLTNTLEQSTKEQKETLSNGVKAYNAGSKEANSNYEDIKNRNHNLDLAMRGAEVLTSLYGLGSIAAKKIFERRAYNVFGAKKPTVSQRSTYPTLAKEYDNYLNKANIANKNSIVSDYISTGIDSGQLINDIIRSNNFSVIENVGELGVNTIPNLLDNNKLKNTLDKLKIIGNIYQIGKDFIRDEDKLNESLSSNKKAFGGKTKNNYVPNVVRGGIAKPLGNNYFLMKGRKHSQGGIDIGEDPRTGLEVEDKEVVKADKTGIKVFSAVPFLNGKSPAQMLLGGGNPDKIFKAQEDYKKRNNLNDDGTKKNKSKTKSVETKMGGKHTKDKYISLGEIYNKKAAGGTYVVQANGKSRLMFLPLRGSDYNQTITRDKAEFGTNKTGITVKVNTKKSSTLMPIYVKKISGSGYELKYVDRKQYEAKGFSDGDYEDLKGNPVHNKVTTTQIHNYTDVYTVDKNGNYVKTRKGVYKDKEGKTLDKVYLWSDNKYYTSPENKNKTKVNTSTKTNTTKTKSTTNNIDYSNAYYTPKTINYPKSAEEVNDMYNMHNNSLIAFSRSNINTTSNNKSNTTPNINANTTSVNTNKTTTSASTPINTSRVSYNNTKTDIVPANKPVSANKTTTSTSVTTTNNNSNNTRTRTNNNTKVNNNTRVNTTLVTSNNRNNSNNIAKYNLDEIIKNNLEETKNTTVHPKANTNISFKKTYDVDTNNNSNNDFMKTSDLYKLGEFTTTNDKDEYEESLTTPGHAKPVIIKNDGTLITKDSNFNLTLDDVIQAPDTTVTFKDRVNRLLNGAANGIKKAFAGDNMNDTISVGSNIIGSIATNLINKNYINKQRPTPSPIYFQPVKLKTNININPQLDKMRENAATYERSLNNNVVSSRTSLSRNLNNRLSLLPTTNALFSEKENKETELINADKLNRRGLYNKNIELLNNYYATETNRRNALLEQGAENNVSLVNNINTGIQDIISRKEQRGQFRENIGAYLAAHPNVTPELLAQYIKFFNDKNYKVSR